MKISNIKYQISKIHIKDQIFLVFNLTLLLLFLPLSTFAHQSDVIHEEPVPTISPLLLAGLVTVLAIGGFLLWKFMLRNPNPQSQEKNVTQGNENGSS